MPDIASHSLNAMAVVCLLLAFASVSRLLLARRLPDRNFTELRQRIQSWWIMILLLFAVLAAGRGPTISFIAFLSFLALKEFLSIVPTRQADRRVVFWAYLAIPLQYWWIYTDWLSMVLVFIPVYVFLILPARSVLPGHTEGFIRSNAILHWATMLTVFGLSHLAALLMLPVGNEAAGPIGPVLFLLITTQAGDITQFLWGKSLGRRKIIPSVSPGKTWEGLIGGVLSVSLLSALTGPYLTPLTPGQGAFIGFLLGGAGFIGDLVMSSVKRDLGIKDSGSLIPGHGGILDRTDSLFYTAPLFFHLLRWLHY